MKMFLHIKTKLVGLSMMVYGYYLHTRTRDIVITPLDHWLIILTISMGFILLFTGDKYINIIIELLIDKIKKLIK